MAWWKKVLLLLTCLGCTVWFGFLAVRSPKFTPLLGYIIILEWVWKYYLSKAVNAFSTFTYKYYIKFSVEINNKPVMTYGLHTSQDEISSLETMREVKKEILKEVIDTYDLDLDIEDADGLVDIISISYLGKHRRLSW